MAISNVKDAVRESYRSIDAIVGVERTRFTGIVDLLDQIKTAISSAQCRLDRGTEEQTLKVISVVQDRIQEHHAHWNQVTTFGELDELSTTVSDLQARVDSLEDQIAE